MSARSSAIDQSERSSDMSQQRPLICEPEITRAKDGSIEHLRLVFGPHHAVELLAKDGRVSFAVGATHHGIRVDASELNGPLERLLEELRRGHPDMAVD